MLEGPTLVDYGAHGTFTAAMIYDDPPGITVTGSGTINFDGDGLVGEATVLAFDEAGASLGEMPVSATGTFDLNAMYGAGVRSSRFRVTANVDACRIDEVTVSPVACP